MMDMHKMEPKMSNINDEFRCTECHKKFRSWKALFGHMRCHPDRRYRGMLNYFRRPKVEPTSTEEDYEVADCLLMLAKGAFHDHSSAPSAANDGGADDRPNATNKLLQINEEPSSAATYDDDREKGKGKEAALILMSSSLVRHKCSKCMRVFSSGQALGGHKRSCLHHHPGEEGSSLASLPSSRVVNLGFDLNSCPLLLNVQGISDIGSNISGLDLELRL
ncbi:hypothetical protein CASFOL_033153 [Castilleja foliolosa]|uniref:C2H2-type domain-containing protein n=1 Tax=Castilleja foliolosa TaxID=1961234 RepID=A0ABD3C473_9LAMI